MITMMRRALNRIHLSALTTAWIVMAACVGVVGNFPVNDDWIYGGATRSILAEGSFRIPGPTIANVISQAYWGLLFCLPFGFSYTALRVSTLVLGLAGLCALYQLVRDNGGSSRAALVGSASLATYPLYFAPANSFMTEVPFVAMTLIAMLFLTRTLRTRSTVALIAGTIACLVTVLVRQVGLAVPLAFFVVHAVRYHKDPLRAAAGLLPALVSTAGHVVYQHWLISSGRGPEVYFSGIMELVPAAPVSFLINSVRYTLFALPYVGLPLLPVALMTRTVAPDVVSPRLWRGICWIIALCGLLVLIGLVWKGDRLPVLGNVLMEWGLGPLTQRDTYLLQTNLPKTGRAVVLIWTLATAAGIAGSVVLSLRLITQCLNFCWRMRTNSPTAENWANAFVILAGAFYWGMMLLLLNRYGSFFDRYVLPLAIFGIVVLCLEDNQTPFAASGSRTVAGWAFIACVGLMSVGMTHDYLAWNRTRWAELIALTGRGVSPRQIDGGYEFNGEMLYDPHFVKIPDKSYWWVSDDDYLLTSGPLPGYREVARRQVDTWLPVSVNAVITLRRL